MAAFQVKVITPEKILFEGEASLVQAPGEAGDFGVLAGHSPLISTLRPGVVSVQTEGKTLRFALTEGVSEVNPEQCVVLSHSAKDISDATEADLVRELEEAVSELDNAIGEEEKHRAEKRVELAKAATGKAA